MWENEKEQIRKVICMALSALLELSEKEYDAFASVHPYANFLNSIYSGRKFALRGWDVHYVGVGLMQIGSGIEYLSGFTSGRGLWLILAAIVTFMRQGDFCSTMPTMNCRKRCVRA